MALAIEKTYRIDPDGGQPGQIRNVPRRSHTPAYPYGASIDERCRAAQAMIDAEPDYHLPRIKGVFQVICGSCGCYYPARRVKNGRCTTSRKTRHTHTGRADKKASWYQRKKPLPLGEVAGLPSRGAAAPGLLTKYKQEV